MKNFAYLRAGSVDEARQAAAQPAAMLLAGGTTLLDLAKCGIAAPDTVIDVTHLTGLSAIAFDQHSVSIGALAKMSRVADDPEIRLHFPAVSESLWQAASA
jgi:xanthine dehydrogenase YagS FAD-binding subunit